MNIRGIRHLYRVADTSLRDALIYFREGVGSQFCKVIKVDPKSPFGERLFIFNNAGISCLIANFKHIISPLL